MKIAAVQMDIAWHDRQANHATARRWCEQAAAAGAELVLLPELFATGFAMDIDKTAETPDGPTPTFLKETARELGITLVGGYVLEADGRRGYNAALAVGPDGNELATYRKTHLIGLMGEHRAHLPGPGPVSFLSARPGPPASSATICAFPSCSA
jgi:omega-amidase